MLVFWYLLFVGGVNFVVMSGVDTIFVENRVKRGKEKQPMESRVQSAV
jgi:hypothetical protein